MVVSGHATTIADAPAIRLTVHVAYSRSAVEIASSGRNPIIRPKQRLPTPLSIWPHLQWWRAVADNGQVEEEQQSYLFDAGFETETVDDDTVVIKSLAERLMNWGEPEGSQDDDLSSVAQQE